MPVNTPDKDLTVELADWIDVYNIASCLLEAIYEEHGEHITLQYAKDVWLRCCDTLWDFIAKAVRYSPDPGKD